MMEQSNSMENLHYPMSGGNVRNLARLFEDNSVSRKPNFTLTKSKSKSYSSVMVVKTSETKEIEENGTLSFRDIHSKFESGKLTINKASLQRLPSVTNLECLKLQEIKEISARTDDIAKKIKTNEKKASTFYLMYLNQIVELLLQIGQIETFGNSSIQSEKLSTLQILQKCYSQLRGKLEVFLGDDNSEEEEQKVSIRSSIQRWESMIETKPQHVVPNYSTHYSVNGNKWSDKKIENKPVEIVKCDEVEDDLKMVEHVKVQNLKDIWERRGSEDKIHEETIPRNQREEVEQIYKETIPRNQREEVEQIYEEIDIQDVKRTVQIIEHKETEPVYEEQIEILENKSEPVYEEQIEILENKSEPVYEELIQLENEVPSEEIVEIDPIIVKDEASNETSKEEEDNSKIIESHLEFVNQEKKHTEETFFEEQLPENEVDIEYVNEEPLQEKTKISQVEIKNDFNDDDDDDEFVVPKTLNQEKFEAAKSSVNNFLDEERKNNDQQLEEVDPMFGPPTGIVPDPTKNSEPVQINDDKPSDDQFIVIYEKAEESPINLNQDERNSGNPDTSSSKNIQHMVIEGNASSKEGTYLVLDNRTPEENVLVNGDRV